MSRSWTAAKVAARKRLYPMEYCPLCLWRTGGGFCPRHTALPTEQLNQSQGGWAVTRQPANFEELVNALRKGAETIA